jgi:hypothetical protein
MKRDRASRGTFCLAVLAALLVMAACSETRNRVAFFFEEPEIREAARRYLDAEIRQDFREAFACLAPSSTYLAAHTYDDYLREARASSTRITGYRIIEISKLRDNHDRGKYPRIDKFVQVEVDVTLAHDGLPEGLPVNYSFTFIKEGGKWFKG